MSLIKEIDDEGTICYYNEKNQLHREDGPAAEFLDGEIQYFLNDIYYDQTKYKIKSDEDWKKLVQKILLLGE
jgi:hypothetical protein